MTTFEVAELFKQYVDDSDQTFMSPDNAVTFLNIGYREFVSQVAEEDSNFYATQELYTAVNDDELDLATTLTGNTIMSATPAGDGYTVLCEFHRQKLQETHDTTYNHLEV